MRTPNLNQMPHHVVRIAKPAGVFLFFLAISIIRTHPLWLHMDEYTAKDFLDPLLIGWIFGWNFHSFSTGMAQYVQGNIFYPFPYSFLLSETLLLPSLVMYPFYLLGCSPIYCSNFFFLMMMGLNGCAVYALMQEICKDTKISLLVGTLFLCGTHSMMIWSRPHLILIGILLFGVFFLYRFLTRGRVGDGIWYVLCCLVLLTSNAYFAFGIILCSGLLCVILLPRYRDRTVFLQLCGFVLFLASCYGLHYSFYQKAIVEQRFLGLPSLHTLTIMSTNLANFVWPSDLSPFYSPWLPVVFQSFPELRFFVGFSGMGLAGVGIYRLYRHYVPAREVKRSLFEWHLYFDLLLLAGLTIASNLLFFLPYYQKLGLMDLHIPHLFHFTWLTGTILFCLCHPRIRHFGVLFCRHGHPLLVFWVVLAVFSFIIVSFVPLAQLFETFPFLAFLRIPGRFGVFPYLVIMVLAGLGFQSLWNHTRLRWIRYILLVLFLPFFWLETATPMAFHQIETNPERLQVYQWLKNQDTIHQIVELPMHDHTYSVQYQYYSTFHWKNLLNGYSGYFPFEYRTLMDLMHGFPSPKAHAALRERECDTVIIHRHFLGEAKSNALYEQVLHHPEWEIVFENEDHFVCQFKQENSPISRDGGAARRGEE